MTYSYRYINIREEDICSGRGSPAPGPGGGGGPPPGGGGERMLMPARLSWSDGRDLCRRFYDD